jgi:glycine/D-amino acid oxidase-like deaminating enzyme
MHQGAARRGAILHAGQQVTGFRTSGGPVVVETASGSHEVDRLVVAAGPWLPELEHSIGRALPVEVERQLSHWFAPETPNDGRFASDRTPIALWELSTGGDIFATFPEHGGGVKCGMHHAGAAATARSVKRTVDPAETEAARELLQQVMPGAGGALVEARVCLYTNTPDRHFLIDWVCGGRVLLVSACSGHGFKFASAIGEIAAQLLLDGRAWIDLEPFSLSRFG